MQTNQSVLDQIRGTFFPYAAEATAKIQGLGGRFAYYTTASTAILIFRNREFWLRSTLVMNDYMEVQHGLECLSKAYKSPSGADLDSALDSVFPGISNDVKEQFAGWTPGFQLDTFVACVSEHRAADDEYGRLSMWRAYGGSAGVALVLNGGACFRPTEALAAYATPVAYMDERGIANSLKEVARNIRSNQGFVQGLGRDRVQALVFTMLRYAVVATKHPAFREEQEWRIVASPALQSSSNLRQEVEVIGGVPQTVLKISLEDHPEQGLYGITPTDFFDKVLIGPCEHPEVIRRALGAEMKKIGIEEPMSRIVVTDIPIRPNQR